MAVGRSWRARFDAVSESAAGIRVLAMGHRHDDTKRPLAVWENALCGAVAGIVSRTVIAPIDVVKIRLQTQAQHQDRSLLQMTRTIMAQEGLRGFWKGNKAAVVLYVGYGAIQFSTYSAAERYCREAGMSSNLSYFVGGAAAGAAGTLVTYPFDLLRTRYSLQGTQRVRPARVVSTTLNKLRARFTRAACCAPSRLSCVLRACAVCTRALDRR